MHSIVSKSFQVFHDPGSSSSSSASSSSEDCDVPLLKFNRLLQSSLAKHWSLFRSTERLNVRGRSISDVGICTVGGPNTELEDLGIQKSDLRLSLQPRKSYSPVTLVLPSTGGSSTAAGVEEHSDGSDADKPRRHGQHLRVPTPSPSQSTGNFGPGAAAGGCGAPRSAPATPLQIEPHPRQTKHDKHAVKVLSSSVPSVRVATLPAPAGAAGALSDASEGKAPSKSRQKKFLRHFPQVGPDERVLNYYSCALVGDILLQGHLYITKNYFAFYSNVFGYVTKLLIPTTSVLRVSKEKMARIIPNAVGVCTRDERHVFGSLLSRDSTYKLMMHVWKAAGVPELIVPPPQQELRISEVDYNASEYSPADESSSGGVECTPRPNKRRESEAIISTGGAAVIQPALLTGASAVRLGGAPARGGRARLVLMATALVLAASALCMSYRLYHINMYPQDDLSALSGTEVYSELMRWRTKLHGRAATELHAFLTTNLLLLTKVRQSLETLSSVILSDMNQSGHDTINIDVPPNDTAFS